VGLRSAEGGGTSSSRLHSSSSSALAASAAAAAAAATANAASSSFVALPPASLPQLSSSPQPPPPPPSTFQYSLASSHHRRRRARARVDRQKLIIILVGLPGRGKTFLCNKLLCYLNWLGHETRHFNVGQFRRAQKGQQEVQDASFFDHRNAAGRASRERALAAALDEMERWLGTRAAQIAVFDATNSTSERRAQLRARFHGRWQYLFIESICNDQDVLEMNYRFKMMYSPDYTTTGGNGSGGNGNGGGSGGNNNNDNSDAAADATTEALADFRARIRKYEEVYETITDRSLHYIKLIDMVTGKGKKKKKGRVCCSSFETFEVLKISKNRKLNFFLLFFSKKNQKNSKIIFPQRLYGRQPHLRLHPGQDRLLPHAGLQSRSRSSPQDLADQARRV
jgi:hypothetical protein